MKHEQVTAALRDGVTAHGNFAVKPVDLCRFADSMHATLSRMAKDASWWQAAVLRTAAGWITDWKRRQGCT